MLTLGPVARYLANAETLAGQVDWRNASAEHGRLR
jgi:hypothetical protein